ncbi:MAG: DNA translocase FtsK 4TM domain-containing protein, partial [Sandaracinaceae bacterium]|nr:DNA translocase FtsK 4TM domain-containing protein [Sandaracinaceae bacterium]
MQLSSSSGQVSKAREALSVTIFAVALLCFWSMMINVVNPSSDSAGFIGLLMARSLIGLLGWSAWVVPLELIYVGIRFLRGNRPSFEISYFVSFISFVLIIAALLHLAFSSAEQNGVAGGVVGELAGELLKS